MFFPLGFGIKQVQFDSVSSGLNLWLTLKSEKDMPELLRVITSQRNAIDFALKNLHNVHFARFVPTPDSKVLQVITAFDGELDAYILDFVLAIGKQFDMILEHIQGWPPKNAQVNQGAGTYSVKDHPNLSAFNPNGHPSEAALVKDDVRVFNEIDILNSEVQFTLF